MRVSLQQAWLPLSTAMTNIGDSRSHPDVTIHLRIPLVLPSLRVLVWDKFMKMLFVSRGPLGVRVKALPGWVTLH